MTKFVVFTGDENHFGDCVMVNPDHVSMVVETEDGCAIFFADPNEAQVSLKLGLYTVLSRFELSDEKNGGRQ